MNLDGGSFSIFMNFDNQSGINALDAIGLG
jgi:hypothetical protein